MARQTINFLVLIAFVVMGVSPACKFVSGAKGGPASLIEICTLEGIKLLPQPEQAPAQNHHKPKSTGDCVFCFARDNTKTLEAAAFQLPAPFLLSLRDAPAAKQTASSTTFSFAFQARAPPV